MDNQEIHDKICKYFGMIIADASFNADTNEIILILYNFLKDMKTKMTLWDDGQCCEKRYFTFDDDLDFIIGKQFTGITTKEGKHIDDEDGVHEINFLEIFTTKGSIIISAHNEHNGYYGGIDLEVKIKEITRYLHTTLKV
jgi:hypothetical protein